MAHQSERHDLVIAHMICNQNRIQQYNMHYYWLAQDCKCIGFKMPISYELSASASLWNLYLSWSASDVDFKSSLQLECRIHFVVFHNSLYFHFSCTIEEILHIKMCAVLEQQ